MEKFIDRFIEVGSGMFIVLFWSLIVASILFTIQLLAERFFKNRED